jgi:hypothetical protein
MIINPYYYDQRSWVVNAAGWSTQLGGQRSWVVNAAGWSTEMNDLTAFSNGLDGDGFFKWVGWGRLFQMSWMGTAFSTGLDGDGFLSGLNKNGFFRLR